MSLMELHPADKREEAVLENLQLMLTGKLPIALWKLKTVRGEDFQWKTVSG